MGVIGSVTGAVSVVGVVSVAAGGVVSGVATGSVGVATGSVTAGSVTVGSAGGTSCAKTGEKVKLNNKSKERNLFACVKE